MVDLSVFMPENKGFKVNPRNFIGTTVMNIAIGKYAVQMVVASGIAIPSRVVGTNGEAELLELEIWKAIDGQVEVSEVVCYKNCNSKKEKSFIEGIKE
jgi:hypothetical protein